MRIDIFINNSCTKEGIMKRIEVVGKGRGFLENLYSTQFGTFEFVGSKNTYEISNSKTGSLYKLFKSSLFDALGIVIIPYHKTRENECIIYNRFLFTNRKYYIILENPTALFHYCLDRKNGLFFSCIKKRMLDNDKLKQIICISDACLNTFNKIFDINCNKLTRIYPLIPDVNITENELKNKCLNKKLVCTYVSSQFVLKSGLEILEVANICSDVDFLIVTKINSLESDVVRKINKMSNVTIYDFNLNKDELNKLYFQSNILLNITRQDSFSLVNLEAIKHGLVTIGTDLYAIPEMVVDGYNGYLSKPKYRFFSEDNMPNPEVWNNRESTIMSNYIDSNLVSFTTEKIKYLDKNRDVLFEFSKNAYQLATTKFGESTIKNQWENIVNDEA